MSNKTKRTILLEEFKRKILSGEMRPGELFPSALKLAPSYNISLRTATGIIRELGDIGLLDVAPGRRSIVCAPRKNPKRPRFDKPIGIICLRGDLLCIAQWRDWLLQQFQERLHADVFQTKCLPENFRDVDLKAYSGFIVAGEILAPNQWETLQETGLPCVNLSFFRPQPNTVYMDYRAAMDQVALFLAKRECQYVIMLSCGGREAKYASNWFNEIGFIKTLQDYHVDEYGFQRLAIIPGASKEQKHLRNIVTAVKKKTAFLTSSPAYSQMILELMKDQKKNLGTDYEIISLSRAPDEPVIGEYIDMKCQEIANKMLDILYAHQMQRKPQVGQVVIAEFNP